MIAMKGFVMIGILMALIHVLGLIQPSSSQIPAACSDANSLENSICCPDTGDGVCGEDSGRGLCVSLNQSGYSTESTDVRRNWPHYFTQVCQCNGIYGGYDCGRCRYGYYGSDCSQKQVLPRRPIHEYTDEEWNDFIQIIQMSKTYQSDYMVILEEARPGTSNLTMSSISLYNLFVWLHHFAAKDSGVPGTPNSPAFVDYAHFGPAFITWHRHFNIWFEYEVQWMLQRMGRPDYHTYRSPYFDWRREIQESSGVRIEDILVENRFGSTNFSSGFPVVSGPLVEGWESVCARMLGQVCDPNVPTGPIQRCPVPDRCLSSNPDWPTLERVNRAISFETFDAAPWNAISSDGFRSFVDFEIGSDPEVCRNDRMCMCAGGDINCTNPAIVAGYPVITLASRIHTTLHFVAGTGDFKTFSYIDPRLHGSMLDVASSPNDPLFILHHTAVDCVFEEWLKRYPNGEYPDSPDVPLGHLRDGYMVPFYPLFTNNDMFKLAENFGYSCSLPDLESKANALSPSISFIIIIAAAVRMDFVFSLLIYNF